MVQYTERKKPSAMRVKVAGLRPTLVSTIEELSLRIDGNYKMVQDTLVEKAVRTDLRV